MKKINFSYKNKCYLYLLFSICIDFSNSTQLQRIDISIESLRLKNVFFGSSEPAQLYCNYNCLNSHHSSDVETYNEGTITLNGYGSRFISMPKKNYRFTSNNNTLVLVNTIEPGHIVTALFNDLTKNIGGNSLTQNYVELYINNNYNGLYYTKSLSNYNNTDVFKIETDNIPENSEQLNDMDINLNFDNSYNLFSYLVTLLNVDDISKHNYVILRNPGPTYGIVAWDTDLALNSPSKSPAHNSDILGSIPSIFMLNRLQTIKNDNNQITIFHKISSNHNLFNTINNPKNITLYKNNFINHLTVGALTVNNISKIIDNYNLDLSDAINRDESKWGDYYCPNDNLFSMEYLKQVISNRHESLVNALIFDNLNNYDPLTYKYCNYVSSPSSVIISIGSFSILSNLVMKNVMGCVTSAFLVVCYLVFNRFDLANASPVLNESYFARKDIISLILCFILLISFSPSRKCSTTTKNVMLLIYTCISIALSTIGLIETIQLGELSKTHQSVSSTGKIIIDTSVFDVRRGEILFVLFVYWKLICQLVFVQVTLRIPNICGYSPPNNGIKTVNKTENTKKKIITRFIKGNIFAFIGALIIIFAAWPPNLTGLEIVIQTVSATISSLMLFNLRGIYVILKWAMLKHYKITEKNFNVIMSNRNNNIWNLQSVLIDEQRRLNNRVSPSSIVDEENGCYAEDTTVDTTVDTTEISRRMRTADAFPKKLSHVVDGLVVFILSVQQLGNDTHSLIDVITLSGAIIMLQLIMYGVSYSDNGKLGFIMYGSKARIMDGYLGRENEIFGWICDKYMLPLSFALEQLLGEHLDESLVKPVSFMIFMPIIVGDSFGEIIGSTWGKQKINVWGMGEINKKSYEGTFAVFASSLICLVGASAYYKLNIFAYILAFVCSFVSTIVELYAPRSTDNVFMLIANLGCCLLFASQLNLDS